MIDAKEVPEKVGKLFKKKIGPVPVWVIGVVGVGGYVWYARRRDMEAATTPEGTDQQAYGYDGTQSGGYADAGLPSTGGYYDPGTGYVDPGTGGGGGGAAVPTDPNVITCPDGSHWDDFMVACVPDTQGTVTCPPGSHYDGIAAACIPDGSGVACPPGSHWNDDQQGCVNDTTPKPTEPCPSGTHRVGGKCVAINDPKPHKCGNNHHWNGRKCVANHTQCGAGMHWNGSKCVHTKTKPPCPAGHHRQTKPPYGCVKDTHAPRHGSPRHTASTPSGGSSGYNVAAPVPPATPSPLANLARAAIIPR